MWEQLVEAIKTNNERDVIRLLQTKPEFFEATGSDGHSALYLAAMWGRDRVAQTGSDGHSALHLAAMWGRDRMAQMLIEKNPALIDRCGKDGYTALHLAAQGGHVKVVELLLPKMESSSIGRTGTNGYTALHLAAMWGRDEVVQILVKAQPELIDAVLQEPYKDRYTKHEVLESEKVGYTALHLAVEEEHEKVIELLLKLMKPESINIDGKNGYTALHLAAKENKVKVVELMLKMKPDLITAVTQHHEYTALHIAADEGHDKVIEILLQQKANYKNRYELNSALDKAIAKGHNKIVGLLLQQISPESLVRNSHTPLHIAAEKGNYELVQLLLQVNPKLVDMVDNEHTALHLAAKAGSDKAVALLLPKTKPKLVTAVDANRYTVLHFGAGNDKIVELLLQTHPDLANIVDKDRHTALHLAAKAGSEKAVALLLPKTKPELAKVVDRSGYTILHHGAGNDKIVELLLQTYPDLADISSKGYKSALASAIEAGNGNSIALLFESAKISESSLDRASYPLAKALKSLREQAKQQAEQAEREITTLEARLSRETEAKSTQTKIAQDAKSKLSKLTQEKDTIEAQLTKLTKEKDSLASKIQQLNERLEQEQKEKSDQTRLIENMHAKLAQLIQEKETITYELTVLNQTKSKLEAQLKPFLQKDREERAKMAEEARLQDEQERIKQTAQLAKLQYPPERIKKLLEIQLQSKEAVKIEILDLQNGNATDQQVQDLLQLVLGQNKILAIALHLRGDTWASLVISKYDDDLQIIYNNPNGEAAAKNQSVSALMAAIASHYENGGITSLDLRQVQQKLEADSAVFVVDNLVKLATTKIFKKAELQNLLSKLGNIELLRKKHSLIEDDRKAYDEEKFTEILTIACKDKAMQIEPVTRLEDAKQLTKNAKDAAEKVMQTGVPTILPLLSSSGWSGLVIKKHENDSGLQVIYIDPKGNKLATQPNAKILLSQILAVNPEVQIIDISKNQQTRDEDSGFLTIDNLVKLSMYNTFGLNKAEISKITIEQNAAQALRILYNKMFEQTIMGAEYQHGAWEDDQNAANNAPYVPEGGAAAQFIGSPPPYDDHAQEHVKLLGAE